MKKEPISIRKDIQPGERLTFKERLKDKGALVAVNIRFYPGVERDLRVRPYIMHKNTRPEEVLTYVDGGDPYITGDDDYLIFPVFVTFENDDEYCCEVENVGSYPYTLVIDALVEYDFESEV